MSFILCPECSFCLGEVYEFIDLAKQGYYKSVLKKTLDEVSPENLELCPNISKPIGFIMDAVGVTNMCCRMHVLGVTNFDKIYK
jgi:DNA-directed RNA polymerase subunit N (RpoN/RPB10)